MPFIQVDPSKIQFDAPSASVQAPTAPSGFISVDPSKITFDKPGFFDRLGNDLVNRANEGADAIVAYKAGDQGLGQTALQFAGKMGAGSLNDVIGEGINSIIPDSAKQAVQAGAQKLADTIDNTSTGKSTGDALLNASNAYGDWAKNNPNAARSLESATNIASTLPFGKAVESAANTISDIPGAVKKVADLSISKDVGTSLPSIIGDTSSGGTQKAVSLTPSDLEKAATIRYGNAEQMGGMIQPQGFADTVNAIKQKVGYQTPAGIAFAGENPITDTFNRLDNVVKTGQPVSLAGLDEIDGRLNSDISKAMRAGDKESASKLLDIKSMLKNSSSTVQPQDLVNPQAFDEWRAGDALWSAKSKMQQLQGIMDNAYLTDNPDTAMRTGYRNLYKQLQRNPAGWSSDEIALVQKGAERGIAGEALKAVSGRLLSHFTALALGGAGGAVGGLPGAIAGFALGEGAGFPLRAAANALQENRAMAPLTAVANRPAVNSALPLTMKQIMQLPPAQARAALNALKP